MCGAAPFTGQHALHNASHQQHMLATQMCSVAILHKPLCAKILSRLHGPMGSKSGDDLADIADAGSEVETAPNDNDNESLSDSPELMRHGAASPASHRAPSPTRKGCQGPNVHGARALPAV